MATVPTSVEAPRHPLTRIAVMLSGRGSNALAIASAIRLGDLTGCEIGLVFSNAPGAVGIESARIFGLPVVTLEGRGREQSEHEHAIQLLFEKFRIGLICLDGYQRVLSADFIARWQGRILDIHASLLPAFPGDQPVKQALDSGVRFTGATVHFADTGLEHGPVILQHPVEILDSDDEALLTERILAAQHWIYPEAVRRVLSGDYTLLGRRYILVETAAPEPDETVGVYVGGDDAA